MRTAVGYAVNTAATPTSTIVARNQQQQHSPWHSPVPYLFGGLAAMLGLIAFALLILACSYWKISGFLESGGGGGGGEQEVENGEAKAADSDTAKAPPVFEEKIVVIMAGDEKPTFLATPTSSRVTSFGDNDKAKSLDSQKKEKEEEGNHEEDGGDGNQTTQDDGHRGS